MKKLFVLLATAALLASCATTPGDPTPQMENDNTADENTASASVSSAPVQPSAYTLDALRARSYGEGELSVEYAWENKENFTRYYITYPSDGLTIHGFVNIPLGKGPFPVIIALHGYIPPSEYTTRDYSTRYADALSDNGYIVLHPNMRNFPPSTFVSRTRDYQAGYVVDVLNLLALVRKMAGTEGIFKNADMTRLGIWGHSLGGGVALRTVSILPEIKAAVIYAAVSQRYSSTEAGFPIFDYEFSQAAFSIHHGEDDDTIDLAWSERLNQQLLEAGKQVEFFTYPNQPHTLFGQNDATFMRRMRLFYDSLLK